MISNDFQSRFEATVRCDFFGLDIAAVAGIASAVVGVVGTGISLIGGMQAASAQQAAANQAAQQAQVMANYNAQLQQQNAMVAYQMQVAQSQQQSQLSQFNIRASQQMQDANTAIVESNQKMSMIQSSISRQNADISRQNADLSRLQATAAQKQHDQSLQNAKQQETEAENIRSQQREEARRLREESEQRLSSIRAKYGSSGVTFEGSPLVVLADAARLAETSVQDAAYIAELEARKQFREAEMTTFKARFSLLDKAGFMTQAAAFEAGAFSSEIDAFGSRMQARAGDTEIFNLATQGAMERAGFETQVAAAQYDTIIAGTKHRIALNEAELTRFGGAASAFNIKSQAAADGATANANLLSGIGTMAGQAVGAVGTIGKALAKPKIPVTPGFSR